MTDSIDQIAALARQWGGDPDKQFGQSPHERAAYSRSKYRNPLIKYLESGADSQLAMSLPLNPYLHSDIIQEIEDVAVSANAMMPALYRFKNTPSPLTVMVMLPDTLILDLGIFRRLPPEQQKAEIAHELQHLKQPEEIMLTTRLIGVIALLVVQSFEESKPFPGSRWALSVFQNILDQCIARVAQWEFEADAQSAALTSPETVQQLLVNIHKILLENKENPGVDFTQPLHEVIKQIDVLIGDGAETYIITGCPLLERVNRLDKMIAASSQARPIRRQYI